MERVLSFLRVRGWRIQRKIVVPFTVLVIAVMGLSAVATLLLFNRYTEHNINRTLRRWLDTVTTTGFIEYYLSAEDLPKMKKALDVDVVTSDVDGEVIGTTLDRTEFRTEDHARLRRLLKSALDAPERPRTFRFAGQSYRLVSRRIGPERRVVLMTLMAPLSEVEQARRRMAMAVAGITLAGILLVALIGNRIARAITTPIHDLVAGTRRVADGDLTHPVRVRAEDEIHEFASAFNEMTAQLQRSREELVQAERLATAGQMAATFAHEIRNPLSSIRMMLQLAAEQTKEPKTARYIEHTLEETNRLNGIVEEMLDFSRPSTLNRTECDVWEVVQDVLELMAPNFAHHHIRSRAQALARPRVLADVDAFKRALLNVLLNAVQAQPEGGEVSVLLDTQDRGARVIVSDRGPGFSEDALEALFRPFFTTKTRGNGLGLATTKRVLEQHGGTVLVENRPDGGARVTLWLPENSDETAGKEGQS